MQCLGTNTEKSMGVRLVGVRSDECGSPGAESTIGKEFHTATSEALVEAIVDETRYLGAPIIIGVDMAHQVDLDLSQNVHSLSIMNVMGLTGRRPSSAILRDVSHSEHMSKVRGDLQEKYTAGRTQCRLEAYMRPGCWLTQHAQHHASSFQTTEEFLPQSAQAFRSNPSHCR